MVPRAPTIAWVLAILVPIAIWVLLMEASPEGLTALWNLHFADPRRERLFVASSTFLLTFGILRGITYSIHSNAGPFRNIVIGGLHIHHLVWGVLILLVVG